MDPHLQLAYVRAEIIEAEEKLAKKAVEVCTHAAALFQSFEYMYHHVLPLSCSCVVEYSAGSEIAS